VFTFYNSHPLASDLSAIFSFSRIPLPFPRVILWMVCHFCLDFYALLEYFLLTNPVIMDSDFRAFLDTPDPGAKPFKRRRGYNAFLWTVCFLLLMGVVMASWIGSFYVFNHPENPDCYQFLRKLNRIEPLKRFEVTAAPTGKFFTAKELFATYATMPRAELEEKNNELLRDYLRNYANLKTPVPYISGKFTTTGVYELGNADMFQSGMVALANSKDCPYVQIEHIYPTDFANVPRARQMLATEPEIDLEKTFDLSTIVHVQKLEDGRMLFTVIPLGYGQYAYKQGISSTFRLDPPASLNLEAEMPVVKGDAMANAVKIFALYRKNRGMLAKGKMLTVPPAVSMQTTDLLTAQDIPPEAYQPLKPAITAPVAEPAPENTITSTTQAPPVTESSAAVPPVSAPAPTEAATIAQIPAASSATEPIREQAPVPPVAPAPVVAKVPPALPHPAVVSAAPVAPASAHLAAPVKLEKTVAKISVPPLSPPAPDAKPIARVQTNPHVSTKPLASVASIAHIPAKPAVAPAAPTPFPIVERAEPVQESAPGEYAKTIAPEPSVAPEVKRALFLASQSASNPQQQQQPVAPAKAANWQTYRPGMMPRGKLVSMYEAMQLADLGVSGGPVYVQGRFIVTASSDGRVVLRPANLNGGISGSSMRILVEYPGGVRIPAEGTQVARGPLRPFQIMDVRRGNDGEVNVYAREVTEPVSEAPPYAVRYYPNRVVQRDSSFD
jgi:hypothetical protein